MIPCPQSLLVTKIDAPAGALSPSQDARGQTTTSRIYLPFPMYMYANLFINLMNRESRVLANRKGYGEKSVRQVEVPTRSNEIFVAQIWAQRLCSRLVA